MRALKALGPTSSLLHELKFSGTKDLSVTKAEYEVSQAGNHVVSHCFGIHAGLLLHAEVLCDVRGVAGAALFHNWLLPHRLDFLQLIRQPDMQHDSLEVLSICAARKPSAESSPQHL